MRWIHAVDSTDGLHMCRGIHCVGATGCGGDRAAAAMGSGANDLQSQERAYVDADARVCDVLEYAGADCVEAAARLLD